VNGRTEIQYVIKQRQPEQMTYSMPIVKLIKVSTALIIISSSVLIINFHYYQFHKTGVPRGWDFIQYYSASILSLQGQASSIYNFDKLSLVESSIAGFKVKLFPYFLLWNYPPSFILLIIPLSLLPYNVALILWLFVFFLTYIIVLYRIAPNPLTLWLAIAFPANFSNFLHCQNGFLFGTLLGAGLLLLNRRPLLAGILLGLVACKPHLAFIIPLALIAGRHWKALSAMVIMAIVMFVGSTMLFGLEIWKAFLDNAPFVRQILESGAAADYKSPSIFATARMLSASVKTAYFIQIAAAIVAIGVMCYIWWRDRGPEISNSVLVLSILISTPYLFMHDLTILAIPLAYFIWQNYDQKLKLYEMIILALAWGLPLYGPSIALLTHVQIAPLIYLAFMVIILQRLSNFGLNKNCPLSSAPTEHANNCEKYIQENKCNA
jgi:alpha-1,2-mannosyltransferase